MRKITINIRGLYNLQAMELKEVMELPCEVENIVYLKNDNPKYPEERYIAFDFETGLSVVAAGMVKDLKSKVEALKDRIETQRNLKDYQKWIVNQKLI